MDVADHVSTTHTRNTSSSNSTISLLSPISPAPSTSSSPTSTYSVVFVPTRLVNNRLQQRPPWQDCDHARG
eukprot:CAMPEP_0185703390 /NCGR_PEP_ID=MMETSP1164-20130828/14392_1 /TAXON_ID=1104430 /ORGANISM="Chrysoreinhardia sp, Strain CCMP2950" /LENGTH=70 /DNA_ID=CAMNT_0028370675 /DNA_START=198 /DNA_END=410 /DNA_ORIENTATION=+